MSPLSNQQVKIMSLPMPSHQLSANLLLLLLLPLNTASAVLQSACTIPTITTTVAMDTSTFVAPTDATATSPAPASTTALWQIDPMCLPGVAQCHHFGDRFRYCNATGFWVPNYCGGDWICCAYSARNGAGPMCESREQCEVVGGPGMALGLWE